MSNLNVEVTGFRELEAKIKALANDKDKKREMLMILRQVAKPTLMAAKQTVPVSKKSHKIKGKTINPGNLKKSIGNITGKRGNAKRNPTIYVGPRTKGANDGWYGKFVHDKVNTYKKGFKRVRKKGANDWAAIKYREGNPFMTKAYELTKTSVTADAEKRMAAFIQRRINKLA